MLVYSIIIVYFSGITVDELKDYSTVGWLVKEGSVCKQTVVAWPSFTPRGDEMCVHLLQGEGGGGAQVLLAVGWAAHDNNRVYLLLYLMCKESDSFLRKYSKIFFHLKL